MLEQIANIATIAGVLLGLAAIALAYIQLRISTKTASHSLFISCIENIRSRLSDLHSASACPDTLKKIRGETLNLIESICYIYFDGAFSGPQKREIENYLIYIIALIAKYYNKQGELSSLRHTQDTFEYINKFLELNKLRFEEAGRNV